MKYKLVLSIGSAVDAGTALTFYRKSEAQSAAAQWIESVPGSLVYLWDGSTWTQYS